MGRSIARWCIRFAVAAAVFTVTATVWVQNASGWESLGLFIGALVFGVIAAVVWCAAATIGHFYVRLDWARLIVHPVLTVVLFVIVAVVVLAGFLGDTLDKTWREAQPFTALVAVCALADAAVGFALERVVALRPVRSS